MYQSFYASFTEARLFSRVGRGRGSVSRAIKQETLHTPLPERKKEQFLLRHIY
jgi:hypothetical protein